MRGARHCDDRSYQEREREGGRIDDEANAPACERGAEGYRQAARDLARIIGYGWENPQTVKLTVTLTVAERDAVAAWTGSIPTFSVTKRLADAARASKEGK